MKNRFKALLLASALCVTSLTGAVLAENATEGVVEQISEAGAAAVNVEAPAEGESQFAPYYDQMKASVSATLEQLSAMTDDQLMDLIEGTDASAASIAATWNGVREELGVFTGMEEQEIIEDGNIITIKSVANYDAVPANTTVNVDYVFDTKKNTVSLDWDIKYPMSKLIAEAGLNTLLGLGTVFIVLVFLSFVIGNIHWIPDIVEAMKKKKEPAPAAPAVRAQAPEVSAPAAVEEEELVGDEELVAVIAAAIAAYDQAPADGFVVRSIKKAGRRKW